MSDDLVTWLWRQIEGDRGRWMPVVLRYQALAERGHVVLDWQVTADLDQARDRIADCEAKLAILDEHATEVRPTVCGVPGQLSYWCKNCHVPRDQAGRTWCRTVRLLASGYQHRPGYQEGWKPQASDAV